MRSARWNLKGRELSEIHPGIWRMEPVGKMRVGVHFVASRAMLEKLGDDKSVEQATNVATLPGVVDPVVTMPDIHQGYGFPIGGVAAFNVKSGVVSPGGVGYDINCGVRLLTTNLTRAQVAGGMKRLVGSLYDHVPAGVGSQRSDLRVTETDLDEILKDGARWAARRGFGENGDLDVIEEGGRLTGADPDAVSERAKERGLYQLGTLGSGNHFVEVQYVDEIYDEEKAAAFGLAAGGVTVTIHTGSRGLGYQVCSDYLEESFAACRRYGIELVDKTLAAAPIDSPEGRRYLGAMNAAANFAFANRQIIAHWTRAVLREQFGAATKAALLYDVCHNIAKLEELPIGKQQLTVCVHRKGATRAYPPRHPQVPGRYRAFGQPVLVPGDMGRYSFVLAGSADSLARSFGSACHGAGRDLSRSAAKKRAEGRRIGDELEAKGIVVRAAGRSTLVEEMPEAYKDVSDVIDATAKAGIATPVARLRPLGVVKG